MILFAASRPRRRWLIAASRRFIWAGMAVFGWAYLIISFGPWPGNAVGPPPLLPSSHRWTASRTTSSPTAKQPYRVNDMYNDNVQGDRLESEVPGLDGGPINGWLQDTWT